MCSMPSHTRKQEWVLEPSHIAERLLQKVAPDFLKVSSQCDVDQWSSSRSAVEESSSEDAAVACHPLAFCDALIIENEWTLFGETPRAYMATLLPGGWDMCFPVGGSSGYRSM